MFTGIMFRAWTYLLGGYQSTPTPSMAGDGVEISENILGLLVVWCFRRWLLCLRALAPPSLTLVCSTGPWSVSSVAQLCLTLCNPMDCSMPGLPVHRQLPESTQTHVHWVDDAIQPSHPLLSSSPAFNIFQHQGLYQWVRSHQVAKVLEFQLQHQSFQWISGLISYRIDWFDFLAIQGTLRSVIQQHSSKASIFWCSVFFMVQLSHLYMTTLKTIALTSWTFVSKAMSLLFNMLSSLVRSLIYQMNFCPKKDY